MGYRWRRMYYLTGLPGWIRFGYSPGWLGRSSTGLPPTAQWLIQSGLAPQGPQQQASPMPSFPIGPTITKDQEKQFLEQQVKVLESQLETVRKRLEELKKGQSQTYDYPMFPSAPFGYPIPPTYTPSPEEELASLEEYKKQLDEEVKGVEARIEELKKLLEEKKKTPKT